MKAPRKWMNDDFTRALLHLFGMRAPFDLHKDDPLVPYFQYKVGDYQNDYYLYFATPPNNFNYVTEIFFKMYEYRGYDLVRYIEFHYRDYEDKDEFVRFLKFEVIRYRRDIRKYRYFFWVRFPRMKAILETVSIWIEEEEKRLETLATAPVPETPREVIATGTEDIVDKIGEEVSVLLRTHLGRIELYNEHHMAKLIQVLHLLQHLRTPGKKVVRLFKSFSDMDMAALLRQFAQFGDKKTNTLQVKVAEIKNQMKPGDPAVEKLVKALQEFFFPKL